MVKKQTTTKQKWIDPKNTWVSASWFNLGNHILIVLFIATLVFIWKNS